MKSVELGRNPETNIARRAMPTIHASALGGGRWLSACTALGLCLSCGTSDPTCNDLANCPSTVTPTATATDPAVPPVGTAPAPAPAPPPATTAVPTATAPQVTPPVPPPTATPTTPAPTTTQPAPATGTTDTGTGTPPPSVDTTAPVDTSTTATPTTPTDTTPSTTATTDTSTATATETATTDTSGSVTTSTETVDPGPGAGGGCSGATFCEDFEAAVLDESLVFWPDYLRDDLGTYVELDSSVAHSGTQSVRIKGNGFTQMLAVATPGPTFWGRVWLRASTAMESGHSTYVAAVEGSGDPNTNEQVRIGQHQCQLELNRRSDDKELLSNGGTYTCDGGVQFDANTWYCLEFFFDGPGRTVNTYVDGEAITEMAVTDWGPYNYQTFKFGYEQYHGNSKDMWYDDLALGSTRIGCE